jgi:hypothetical protein
MRVEAAESARSEQNPTISKSSYRAWRLIMSSYQASASVKADAKTIFAFVCNPDNFAKFVPCISQADTGYGDVIHIEGECPHGPFRGVGGYHIDEENNRMRWDSRANLNYRGWLQVNAHEDDSMVLIHLEFDPGVDRQSNKEFTHVLKDHPQTIQSGLEETLARIKANFEEALTLA